MKQIMATVPCHTQAADIEAITHLLTANPTWGRTRLSEELCRRWNWYGPKGQPKDMACRTLLLKLERAGLLRLPARKRPSTNQYRNRRIAAIAHPSQPVCGSLQELLPLRIAAVVPGSQEQALFRYLLATYHYLSFQNTVGENIQYLVYDRRGRSLACLLFGSAAWKAAARDSFIGWDPQARQAGLGFMTNNTRFLILPWIRVPHLASHILSGIAKRICADWLAKYGHPVYLLETFVDRSRYRGTCYRAANWTLVGTTSGRSRNDRHNQLCVPVKDIYLYPLTKKYRGRLCAAAAPL